MDIEKLRAQPEIIAPEYFNKMKQEFGYIPMTDQVKDSLSSTFQVVSFINVRTHDCHVTHSTTTCGKGHRIRSWPDTTS